MLVQQIQNIMQDAAPLAELLVMDFYEDRAIWHMAADRDSEIFGELDKGRNVLVLSMPLASPPAMDQQLLELALQYSHAWDSSSGLHLTLEGSSGPFWLVTDVGIMGMTPQAVADLLRNFVAKGATWREIIQQPPSERAPEEPIAMTEGMMRI